MTSSYPDIERKLLMTKCWRLRLKSGMDGIDHVAARQFALQNGILGGGWSLEDAGAENTVIDGCTDYDLYFLNVMNLYNNDKRLAYAADIIGRQINIGDFVWTYVTHLGEYWCARITGDFVYRQGVGFNEADLHIVRNCEWKQSGTAESVPGAIRRAFAGQFGTITALKTGIEEIKAASETLFGLREPQLDGNLFDAASPDDLEDLVGLYLQAQGWWIIPSTISRTMASYEFVLVNANTGKRAGLQVKSGNVWSLTQNVAEGFDQFFVFLANEKATVQTESNKIIRIPRSEIETFAHMNWHLLPKRLQSKWRISAIRRSC